MVLAYESGSSARAMPRASRGAPLSKLRRMAITATEAKRQILDDLGGAIDRIGLAVAALGEAFELLPEAAGERLETTLFRPVQRAYARSRRTHAGFAERSGLPSGAFELPSAGLASQGVGAFAKQAVVAVAEADRKIAELQDSLLPIESGDAELRSGLSEVRELLAAVPAGAREFLRTLGR